MVPSSASHSAAAAPLSSTSTSSATPGTSCSFTQQTGEAPTERARDLKKEQEEQQERDVCEKEKGQLRDCVQVVWEVHVNRRPPAPDNSASDVKSPGSDVKSPQLSLQTPEKDKPSDSPGSKDVFSNETKSSATPATSPGLSPSFYDLYSFPTPEVFLQESSEESLRVLGFGYRAR